MNHMRLIPLVLIALIAGLHALAGYMAVQNQREIVALEERRDLLTTGRTAAAAAAEVWSTSGEDGVRDLLDRIARRTERIEVAWISHEVISGTLPPGSTPPRAIETLGAGESHVLVSKGGLGERTARAFVPVIINGHVVGAIALESPIDSTSDLARGTVVRTAVSAALTVVAVIAAFVLGWIFARRPTKEMREKARRVLARDPTFHDLSQRSDSIDELARAIDVLGAQYDAARSELRVEADARLATLEQLQHADRLKTVGQLTSGILHELGTPLTIVSGRAAMIADGEVEGAEAAASARIAVEQTERITKMVRSILDFARRGRKAETLGDLGELARKTVKLMAPVALKQGVTLRWDGEEVPTPASFDTSLIQQVLANLVLNAIQASSGGGEVTVSVEPIEAALPEDPAGAARSFLALHVDDQGSGISPEMLARIFESFYTTKAEGEGTGLGLPISQQIVTDHGGWIAVKSEPGEGSRFTAYLPREEDAT